MEESEKVEKIRYLRIKTGAGMQQVIKALKVTGYDIKESELYLRDMAFGTKTSKYNKLNRQ